ncbi:MAG: hypothetical protein IPM17_17880 [Verrucomicrobia bacterium]|nr:hypothetical protein [Verrucomicrobiota bacterium]
MPDNIELLLPCGESLRGFMEQPFIRAADLKRTLRGRGVFLGRNDKADTIPALVCCLLSPREFDDLRECQATREDNPKTMTRTILWNGRRPLLEAIPADLNLAALVVGDYVNYRVIGVPAFVPVDGNPDHVCCEFEIERTDLTRNWAATKSNFRGKLEIQRSATGRSITFVLTHTAGETKDLNCKLVEWLKERFKTNGDVRSECEIETVLFSSFDNERRVGFFLSLIRGLKAAGFESCGTTEFQVCPDEETTLPARLKWMGDGVDDLRFNGRALENTFFIKEKEYHKYLLLHGMEGKFKFECPIARGNCAVVFEFPDYGSSKDSGVEFEVNISGLALEPGHSEVNRTEVKEELLRRINEYKLAQFEKFRLRTGDTAAVEARPVVASQTQLNLDSIGG